MLGKKEQFLLDSLAPKAEAQGIEIVTIELVGSKKAPTICVYIDCEGGVSFDILAQSQVWINEVMDEIDPFPGPYTLQVSSPGLDRPLRTLEHFERFAGEKAALSLRTPYQSRSKWEGILKGVDNENVLLEVDGIVEEIPHSHIKKAHVIATIDFNA
ncbi:MAG: ribosome maturation factor RimP [Anaerotardibacter sp.]